MAWPLAGGGNLPPTRPTPEADPRPAAQEHTASVSDPKKWLVATINVTALTKARLNDVLDMADTSGVMVVALQETRHHDDQVLWAKRVAADRHWNMAFSSPPPITGGVTRQGGTAILWRKGLGRAAPTPPTSTSTHRAVSVQWQSCLITSAYGPVDVASPAWLGQLQDDGVVANRHAVIMGDLNWKPPYKPLIQHPWTMAEVSATTSKGTTPTRCLATNPPRFVSYTPIVGIDHHGFVVYAITATDLPPAPERPLRDRQCAHYQWTDSGTILEQAHPITCSVDSEFPRLNTGAPLHQRWQRFHTRTEALFKRAASEGFASIVRPAERPKGSQPTTRPTAPGAKHRVPETVKMRRLRRLHRAYTERLRAGLQFSDLIDGNDLRRWRAIERDNLVPVAYQPTLAAAIDALNRAISSEADQIARGSTMLWRRLFAQWSDDIWKPASAALKAPQAPSRFTANDMAADWEPIWNPPNFNEQHQADEWEALADEAQMPQLPQTTALPTREELRQALLDATGAAGFDGWRSNEVKHIAKHLPTAVDELHELWCDTAEAAPNMLITLMSSGPDTQDTEVIDAIWGWRTVGIPKKSPDASRPISVGSTLVRAWHKALLHQFPPAPHGQWGGVKGTSVIQATAHWLAAPKHAGAELDLSTAYDTIPHATAYRALTRRGVSNQAAASLVLAWKASRTCTVHGIRANPSRPARGAPQGCPGAGATLAAVLSPWDHIIRHHLPGSGCWAFIDDRTIAVTSPPDPDDQLQSALDRTSQFDARVGLVENAGKRQLWSSDQPATTVEHLGLVVAPSNPTVPIIPRGGWTRPEELILRITRLPGQASVKERLAMAYLRPQYTWALPLVALPPPAHAEKLRRAILATQCTWWCAARWWADRVTLHPRKGAAILAFTAAPSVANYPSQHLSHALSSYATELGLTVAGEHVDHGPVLECSQTADPRLLAEITAVTRRSPLARRPPPRHIYAALAEGQHLLRVAARIQLLSTIKPTRLDSEGSTRIDLAAQSHAQWADWRKSLNTDQIRHLNIFRGGATRTPTRRVHHRITCCPFCGADLPSVRHFWVECPHFQPTRLALEAAYAIPPTWWACQPRVTSKSGWITIDAAPTLARRATLQVASCRLGMAIVNGDIPIPADGPNDLDDYVDPNAHEVVADPLPPEGLGH